MCRQRACKRHDRVRELEIISWAPSPRFKQAKTEESGETAWLHLGFYQDLMHASESLS